MPYSVQIMAAQSLLWLVGSVPKKANLAEDPTRMKESLQIQVMTVSLLAGALTIILAYRLMRKYRQPHLSTYFYFLVFLFVFSIYSILGYILTGMVLGSDTGSGTSPGALRLGLIFLGLPFLILSWYMFLRFCIELSGRSLSNSFTTAYFIALFFLIPAYGTLLFSFLRFGKPGFDQCMRILIVSYSAVTIVTVGGGNFIMLIKNHTHTGRSFNRTGRQAGTMYAAFFAIQILLLNLSLTRPLVVLAFILLNFSFHILPILYFNIYSETGAGFPGSGSMAAGLHAFTEEYGISRREAEVVELICAGKSNKDISNDLFISLQTVKDHIYRIYIKTGVKNRVQLTNLIRSPLGPENGIKEPEGNGSLQG